MRKNILSLLAVLICIAFAFTLGGCSGGKKNNKETITISIDTDYRFVDYENIYKNINDHEGCLDYYGIPGLESVGLYEDDIFGGCIGHIGVVNGKFALLDLFCDDAQIILNGASGSVSWSAGFYNDSRDFDTVYPDFFDDYLKIEHISGDTYLFTFVDVIDWENIIKITAKDSKGNKGSFLYVNSD